jgi:hypothetical protein
MAKISNDAVQAAYDTAKEIYEGRLSNQQGLNILEKQYSLNRNSAADYIQNYSCMVEGRRFTRTLNAYATEYFLKRFLEEDKDRLLAALSALHQHIDYYERIGNSRVRAGRAIYERFVATATNIGKDAEQLLSRGQLLSAPKQFLQYWQPKQVDTQLSTNVALEHSGSEQLDRVTPGDIVWIVTVRPPGELHLVGRLVVGEVASFEKTKRQFGSDVWDAAYHVIAKRGTEEGAREISLMSIAEELRFLSKTKRDRLKIVAGKVDAKQLQSLRELTPASADSTERIWYSERPAEQLERAVRKGKGFGDPETNKKVERAAIEHVSGVYRSQGWAVKSVEADKCGYDLHCTKKSKEEHVEVKGVQGTSIVFIVTRGEINRAKTDNDFVLCLVTAALRRPTLCTFSAKELLMRFKFDALAYTATLVS